MNGQISIRLPPALRAQVQRQAAERGITRTDWLVHLIERGQLAESLEGQLGKLVNKTLATSKESGAMPPQVAERVLFAACFSEAILKKLNASLNRSSSELGTVAAQARDQAQAETAVLLKALRG